MLGPTGNAVPELSLNVLAIASQSGPGAMHASVATPSEVGTVNTVTGLLSPFGRRFS